MLCSVNTNSFSLLCKRSLPSDAVPWRPVGAAPLPAPVALTGAEAPSLRPPEEAEVPVATGSPTGSTFVEVPVLDAALDLEVAPAETDVESVVDSYDPAKSHRSIRGLHCHRAGHLALARSPSSGRS